MNINDWITVTISILSLLVSFYSVWRTRKNVTVTYAPNVVPKLNSVYTKKNGKEDFHYHRVLLTSIDIVNSSPIDISYFDLRAFDPKTNLNIDLVTRWTMPYSLSNRDLFTCVDFPGSRYYKLDIPERKFGILPANSFTRMDIVIVLDYLPKQIQNLDTVCVSFKIPKRSLKRDYYSVTNRKKFKFYGMQYHGINQILKD